MSNERSRSRKLVKLALAGIVLAFGLMCLNYTKAGTLEHHASWAQEHDLPPPSQRLFLAGVAGVALGSAAFGYALGRR